MTGHSANKGAVIRKSYLLSRDETATLRELIDERIIMLTLRDEKPTTLAMIEDMRQLRARL